MSPGDGARMMEPGDGAGARTSGPASAQSPEGGSSGRPAERVFDRRIPRCGTGSVKWEFEEGSFGRASSLVPVKDRGVIPMWVADMDFPAPPCVTEAIRRRADHPIFGYTAPTPGFADAFCDWAAVRHRYRPRPEWVAATEGIVPDLQTLVRALLDEGEGVIVHRPVYTPFFGAIRNAGARIVPCSLRVEPSPPGGAGSEAGQRSAVTSGTSGTPGTSGPSGSGGGNRYRLDLERFDELAAEPANRMTFLCHPHNPVGRVWTGDELAEFAEIAARRGLIVVSDEIHADLVLDGRRFSSFLSLPGADASRTVVCAAPSKTFNLAGLKSSLLVVPDETLRGKFRRERDRTGAYGVNPLSAAAAEAAWRGGGEWLDSVLAVLSENAAAVRRFFAERPELGVRCVPVEGTYLAWLDFRGSGVPAADLDSFLLAKARLRLKDGQVFGPEGLGFARMNFACPAALLEEALHRLAGALAAG